MRYRAKMRTNALVVKGDTRVAYNIISGSERPQLNYPDRVPKPHSLAQREEQQLPPSPRVDRRVAPVSHFN